MYNTGNKIDIVGFQSKGNGFGGTSVGYQTKYTNGKVWVKIDKGSKEGLAEEVVSSLLSHSSLNRDDYVEYTRCVVYNKGKYVGEGCVSDNFLGPNEEVVTFQRLLEMSGFNSSDKRRSTQEYDNLENEVVRRMNKITGLDTVDYLRKIITLDAIVLNSDRHLNNIATIYNSSTSKYRFAPIFDNGLALILNRKDTEELQKIYNTTFAKPFTASFEYQYKYFKGPGIKFNLDKVKEIVHKYNNPRITYTLEKAIEKYPEAFINTKGNDRGHTSIFKR